MLNILRLNEWGRRLVVLLFLTAASPAVQGFNFGGDTFVGTGYSGGTFSTTNVNLPSAGNQYMVGSGWSLEAAFGYGSLDTGELILGFETVDWSSTSVAGSSASAYQFDIFLGYQWIFNLRKGLLLKVGPVISFTSVQGVTSPTPFTIQQYWTSTPVEGGLWTTLDWHLFDTGWGLADSMYLYASCRLQSVPSFNQGNWSVYLGLGFSPLGV